MVPSCHDPRETELWFEPFLISQTPLRLVKREFNRGKKKKSTRNLTFDLGSFVDPLKLIRMNPKVNTVSFRACRVIWKQMREDFHSSPFLKPFASGTGEGGRIIGEYRICS